MHPLNPQSPPSSPFASSSCHHSSPWLSRSSGSDTCFPLDPSTSLSSPPPSTSPLASLSYLPPSPPPSRFASLSHREPIQTPKKPTRKYTKKADCWVENGGSGRKGRASARADGAKIKLPPGPTTPSTSPRRPPPRSPTDTSPGGELNRLRLVWELEAKAKEISRPSWLARSLKEGRVGKGIDTKVGLDGTGRSLDLWETEPGSPSKRQKETDRLSRSPYSFKLQPTTSSSSQQPSPPSTPPSSRFRPRTTSAPSLCFSSTGKASLASSQILSSEMSWLIPSSARRRAARVPPPPSSLLETTLIKPNSASRRRGEEKRRLQLLAFDESAEFFASPVTERTQKSNGRSGSSSIKADPPPRPFGEKLRRRPSLVAARVIGVGRVAMREGELRARVEAGTAEEIEPSSPPPPRAGVLSKPDWPDRFYPWVVGEDEDRMVRGQERKWVLGAVERYLDESSDSGEDGLERASTNPLGRNWSTSSSSSSSISSHGGGGGKTGWNLHGDIWKRPRVRSSHPHPVLDLNGRPFDSSDARQAILLKSQTRFRLSNIQLEEVRTAPSGPEDETATEDEGIIGCFCQSDVEGSTVVNCDSCKTWHHMDCIGLKPDELDEEWFCWKCGSGEQSTCPIFDQLLLPSHKPPSFSSQTFQSPHRECSNPVSLAASPVTISTPIRRIATTSSFSSPDRAPSPSPFCDLSPLDEIQTPGRGHFWTSSGPSSPVESSFDLSSTPSRHLSSEDLLFFGGTPLSAHPPPSRSKASFTTPSSQIKPGLQSDRCPSSADSWGPISPSSWWSNVSPHSLPPFRPLGTSLSYTPNAQSKQQMPEMGKEGKALKGCLSGDLD